MVKSLAIDLQRRGAIAVMIHPGWVRTEMGGPKGPLASNESISQVKKMLDELGLEDNGKFMLYDGSPMPW